MAKRPPEEIKSALEAVGELLSAERAEVGIVVAGGTALNLLGIVERTTRDVDVLATVKGTAQPGGVFLTPPDPLPESLRRAIVTVARDLGLPADWMNTVVGLQWQTGLPLGRLHWRHTEV